MGCGFEWNMFNVNLTAEKDLKELPMMLLQAGYDMNVPTLVVLEGVLMYFPTPAVRNLLDLLATFHSATSRLFDFQDNLIEGLPTTCETFPAFERISKDWDVEPQIQFTNSLYLYFDSLSDCAVSQTCHEMEKIFETHRLLYGNLQFGVNPNDKLEQFLLKSRFVPRQIWSSACSQDVCQTQIQPNHGYLKSWIGTQWSQPPQWAYMCLASLRSDSCPLHQDNL